MGIERNWTVKANYTRKHKAGGDSLNIVRVAIATGSDCGAQAKAPRLLSAHYYAFSLGLCSNPSSHVILWPSAMLYMTLLFANSLTEVTQESPSRLCIQVLLPPVVQRVREEVKGPQQTSIMRYDNENLV